VTMASLTLKGIKKKYGHVVALSQIDLHVEDGTFCVLLGPSGCGKSTLLHVVAGLVPQESGAVLLNEKCVDHLVPRERDVAMVFQSYALYPHMTVAQNLGFGLRMRGLSKATIQDRVLETARVLGIENLLGRKPRALSGGQRQRVAMGRALVRRPSVFLLDEPLSNLDARLRSSVRLELKQLHRQIQGTILYVTHDQVEAMTLGDMVVVMNDGRVHQIGPPDEIYARPADTFVATFIGTPEMNLFKGRLLRKNGRLVFEGADLSLDMGPLNVDLEQVDVEIGIRPEDIRIGMEMGTTLEARTEIVSNVGSDKYIHGRIGTASITARAPRELSLRPGEIVHLTFDLSRVHIFHRGIRI
jgi:ABC-type sugar transport system ATPase subunit